MRMGRRPRRRRNRRSTTLRGRSVAPGSSGSSCSGPTLHLTRAKLGLRIARREKRAPTRRRGPSAPGDLNARKAKKNIHDGASATTRRARKVRLVDLSLIPAGVREDRASRSSSRFYTKWGCPRLQELRRCSRSRRETNGHHEDCRRERKHSSGGRSRISACAFWIHSHLSANNKKNHSHFLANNNKNCRSRPRTGPR